MWGNAVGTGSDAWVMKKFALITIAAVVVALPACGSSPWEGTQLDQWGWYACEDFAKQMSKSGGAAMSYQLQPTQRAEFVSGMAQSAGWSTTAEIKDAGVVLSRTVTGPQEAWKLGMDTFATRCVDRGYKSS